MATKAGTRLKFDGAPVEAVVTKGGEGDVTYEGAGGPLQVGKRYLCETTGIEVLITKPGPGRLLCNGAEMPLQQPKQTKSAD